MLFRCPREANPSSTIIEEIASMLLQSPRDIFSLNFPSVYAYFPTLEKIVDPLAPICPTMPLTPISSACSYAAFYNS